MYPETNEVKEDMVGWVTIWKKMDEDAVEVENIWKGKEIMVLVDPNQSYENMLDFYAEASLSQKAAQKSGSVPVKISKHDKKG